MKKGSAGITKRLIAGMLVVVAIVGVSALTIHTPSQHSAARSLNSIQTDKATLFYADVRPDSINFVEQVGESRVSTEHLKLVASTF